MPSRNKLAGIGHELVFSRLRDRLPRRRVEVAADPLCSIVCVSNRPAQLPHILAMYASQQDVRKELVLVTNADGYGDQAGAATRDIENVTVIETAPAATLGSGLNRGVAASSGQVIAKFDDDDFYAENYLATAARTMAETGAGIVGKKTYFVFLAGLDQTMKIYPGNEGKRVGRITGGTLVAHRDVCERVTFTDVNLGEDVRFVRAAERAGFVIYGAPAEGFLQIRAGDHTWQVDENDLAADGILIGPGRRPEYWSGLGLA